MAQFLENITENKKCAFSLQLIFETSIILRIIQQDIIINICGSSYPTTVILVDFQKNMQTSNFVKIHPVEAELFHAD
jgi:hypothetical protein